LLWLGLVAGSVLLWALGITTMLVSDSYSSRSYRYSSGYDYDLEDRLSRAAATGQALIGLSAVLT